jgi:hypothetical protein
MWSSLHKSDIPKTKWHLLRNHYATQNQTHGRRTTHNKSARWPTLLSECHVKACTNGIKTPFIACSAVECNTACASIALLLRSTSMYRYCSQWQRMQIQMPCSHLTKPTSSISTCVYWHIFHSRSHLTIHNPTAATPQTSAQCEHPLLPSILNVVRHAPQPLSPTHRLQTTGL